MTCERKSSRLGERSWSRVRRTSESARRWPATWSFFVCVITYCFPYTSRASLNPIELPPGIRGEKVSVGSSDVIHWRGAGSAFEHKLIAHKFAVVLAERADRGLIAWIGEVGAAGPFPDVAEHLGKARGRMRLVGSPRTPGRRLWRLGGIAGFRRSCPRSARRPTRLPIRIRWAILLRPIARSIGFEIADVTCRLRIIDLL